MIIKRDGSRVPFDGEKVVRSILYAAHFCKEQIDSNDLDGMLDCIKHSVIECDGDATVRTVQAQTIYWLIDYGYDVVADTFMNYARDRDIARAERLRPDPRLLQDYIVAAKYRRRGERGWDDIVNRVMDMHFEYYSEQIDRNTELGYLIEDSFDYVHRRDVLPSMRSCQFGGPALLRDHARMYNCCATLIDRVDAFPEAMYLLLCGCGVGYSVQWHHVNKLNVVGNINRSQVIHHTVMDTIEGWSDAVRALVNSYLDIHSLESGSYIEFDYSDIRPEGAVLHTAGGYAPGHLGLKACLEGIRSLLDRNTGRKLRPIVCSDIMCWIASAVLSGGVRRSAMLGLFSHDDTEMMFAKTGDWMGANPIRAYVNISVALNRNDASLKPTFMRALETARHEYGDPGFLFVDDPDYVTNPCAEIGLYPCIDSSSSSFATTGYAFCNVNEIRSNSLGDINAVRAAAVIGTLQAGYTRFGYLGSASHRIAERDALLGVSLMGIMDHVPSGPEMGAAVSVIRDTNIMVAGMLGINTARSLTTVKPGGTAPIVAGCSSGITPEHSRRYVRRVIADNPDALRDFEAVNPGLVSRDPASGITRILFPVQVPDNAVTLDDITADAHLDTILNVHEHWIKPGQNRVGPRHNISNTVVVRQSEFSQITERIWANRKSLNAMTFVPEALETKYPNAPREAVTSDTYWNSLCRLVNDAIINYEPLEHGYQATLDSACSGGACQL